MWDGVARVILRGSKRGLRSVRRCWVGVRGGREVVGEGVVAARGMEEWDAGGRDGGRGFRVMVGM